ncbi:hypothetical protein C819_03880 [Lachnospiraceae bacterium 10-1]|jgi:peptidoglycan/xylan/chitin deacetylase (PgdA/CDA1 family)|nr:hypothetical protein C819_03880 [Lachnospiraceae bacterium 10-1]
MEGTGDRRKRVQRLKKIILAVNAAFIVIPVIVSVVLGIRVIQLNQKIQKLENLLAAKENEADEVAGIYVTTPVEQSLRDTVSMQQTVEAEEEKVYQKEIYLTFDDGPSSNTDKILDVLKEYDVKATFFVVGKTDEQSIRAYQRIVEEGHTLAMHSYSHIYNEIYESKDNFMEDLEMLQEHLYQITGIWPRFYRFPGGSSNTVSSTDMQELAACLKENGITYFDWNIASGDAISGQLATDSIVSNCLGSIDNFNECMILMHDAVGKNTTIEALPEIISQVMERGDAVFLPITDETVPIQHITVNDK